MFDSRSLKMPQRKRCGARHFSTISLCNSATAELRLKQQTGLHYRTCKADKKHSQSQKVLLMIDA